MTVMPLISGKMLLVCAQYFSITGRVLEAQSELEMADVGAQSFAVGNQTL